MDSAELNWARYGRHVHDLPCDPQCNIHGVLNPVEGDIWNLQRFVEAQDADGAYERAMIELRSGEKKTHWMWFVFPQLQGLATNPSQTSTRFAIRSLAEATAYANHALLQGRYRLACEALMSHPKKDIVEILGATDSQKCHSSLTLFSVGGGFPLPTMESLKLFFHEKGDMNTLRLVVESFRQQSSMTELSNDVSRTHLSLRAGKIGSVWRNLSCRFNDDGDFLIEGHDIGDDSEYEWVTSVKASDVPGLIKFLGNEEDDDLMKIIERDWVVREGQALERLIRLSVIPSDFWSYFT